MKFIPITHQFTLFDYNEMRPKIKVPLKRISKERYAEAMKQLHGGSGGKMLSVLRDINDSLSLYCKRKGI